MYVGPPVGPAVGTVSSVPRATAPNAPDQVETVSSPIMRTVHRPMTMPAAMSNPPAMTTAPQVSMPPGTVRMAVKVGPVNRCGLASRSRNPIHRL